MILRKQFYRYIKLTACLPMIGIGAIHKIGLPIHVYPLYENGFRAHRGQSLQENDRESAQLYAEFAKVAERNSIAWNYGEPAATEKYIGSVTKRNRMICFPCTVPSWARLSDCLIPIQTLF
jgi:hypothetical protein